MTDRYNTEYCIITCLLTLTYFACINSTVVEHRQSTVGPQLVKLTDVKSSESDKDWLTDHIRLRRDAPAMASHNRQLEVHSWVLKDQNHNEAIVHWSGNKSSVMFVLTREHKSNGQVPDSKLWRSENYGEMFKQVDLPRGAVIRYYYSCPANRKKLVFTDAKQKRIYYTEDEGANVLLASAVDFNPDKLMFHPTKEDWLLGYSYTEKTLHVSMDLAKTWLKIGDYVNSRFYWAVDGMDATDTVIHYEKLDPLTGHYSYVALQHPYPTPSVIDPDLGPIDVDSLIVQNEYIFVQKSTHFATGLFVSYKRGPFLKALFPEDVHPQDFRIVNTDEGQVFIAADHQEKIVHLYLSDKTGRFYIKSLQNLVALRQPGGNFDVDLYEVLGVTGTYIANQYTHNNPITLMTFDQGAQWKQISAPAEDAQGKTVDCALPSCGLHIHLSFSQAMNNIPFILSEANAPGMILAQGHVGADLSPGTETKSTLFMSRDGGLTWKALYDGEFNYNILDQGGALVVVPVTAHTKTRQIYYSCTEGKKWETYTFSDLELQVDGVLNEPGITTRIVSVYGHVNRSAGWVIIKVDFSSILSVKCTEDQYETWTPTDDIEDHQCLLGVKRTYNRRNQDAECYNGEDYEHAISTIPCDCIDEDFECAYGYEEHNGECVKMAWFDPSLPSWGCPEGENYNQTKGYRKIASDGCIEGSDLDEKYKSTSMPCPIMTPEGLRIQTNSRLAVATGTLITFTLFQEKGSKMSTQYTWSSGEPHKANITIQGFDSAKTWNHTFTHSGIYTVTLTARNTAGGMKTQIYIRVEDALHGVLIDLPRAAAANKKVEFDVTPLTQNLSGSRTDTSYVHFLWKFGDEGNDEKPFLTYERHVDHVYGTAGNYSASVEAVNSVGSIFRRFAVVVYATLTTIQLSFSGEVEEWNDHSEVWKRLFADTIKETIVRELDVEPLRLEVSILNDALTRADVSVLPVSQTQKQDSTVDDIVAQMINKAHSGRLVIPINTGSPLEVNVTVIDANVYVDKDSGGSGEHHYLGIILAVPTLVAAGFIALLIIVYYRRKFSMPSRRYNILHSHSAEDDDNLLGEDDDDDDPPLDPNPDFNQQRAGEDFGFSGMQSALVMMTGTNNRDDNGTINC